ncbi:MULTISPECIES: ABC transporter ATP-binding protein [Antrihabitans]|uniref:ABC transporter ATP-binding protein n=2 Tax=Antrihabitans TaxID=2799491 RepID=A0A934U310_9NOCA|nr:ABC transporter ATP-binding protein [Antrihabitans stalagmiti]MBJ8339539.1 ABC transporter ATP-binding protein [Antrihabitans stalagmiti]
MDETGLAPTDVAIDVTDLVVVRGRKRVLDTVGFTVGKGSVTGLLGPSGSGKTTLLRAIVGVQKITSGSVIVLGDDAGSKRLRREVGYVTQSPSVYGDLTIAQNARYFARNYGAGAAVADTAVANVGLADIAGQLVDTLSGGQRARVSLACALVAQPALLVLDEPTVGLDPVLRRDLWQQFHDLADAGTTLLISSHVMDEADRCDRLLLLREGKLLADETPAQLLESTGARNLEDAFLELILAQDEVSA